MERRHSSWNWCMWMIGILSVSSAVLAQTPKNADLAKKANELAQKLLIVDGHIDVPYRLGRKDADISRRTPEGDFDYVRAKKGGLNVPFMSIYTPASYQETGGAKAFADSLIDQVEGYTKRWPDKFAIATSVADVNRQFKRGLISLPLGMENGAPIEDDLANVAHFYKRGVRYITLTHGKNNLICDSSYDKSRTWNGLSPFGRKVVLEMNRLGIMVDISHVTDDTFYQVMELTKAPVIASHSSCRKFTPGFERNMNDAMIKKLAANDGVIMINFGSAFLSGKVLKQYRDAEAYMEKVRQEKKWAEDAPEAKAYWDKVRKERVSFADLADVVAHIDHVVTQVGVDHVGLGSDFDGVGDTLPTRLKDVSHYPNLVGALLEKGYSEVDIEKICSGNVMRVWRAVEEVAAANR